MSVPEQSLFGIRPPEAPTPWWPEYVQYSGAQRVLSPPECKAIIDHMGKIELYSGKIGTTTETARIDPEYRSVFTNNLPVQGFEWLYERLLQKAVWVAQQQYRFDLTGLNEHIQYLEYREPENDEQKSGRYKWHMDAGPGQASNRKLSVVVQLSDPTEYKGCRLRIFDCRTPELEVPEIGQGDMVLFPSFTPHCVTPLEKGTRRALALWVSGPTFR